MTIKSVFFDLDGTLIHSVPALYGAYYTFLDTFNVTGNEAEFEELNGKNLDEIVALLKKRHQLKKSQRALKELYKQCVNAAYEKVRSMKGADALLRKLAGEGYTLGLVSSAPRKLAEKVVRRQGWEKLFALYAYGDEVAHAKPHPEIYQRALLLSGDIPEEVVVVEDGPHGVLAATRAGLRTIGFAQEDKQPALRLSGAEAMVTTLTQVPRTLTAWKKDTYRIIAVGDTTLKVVPTNSVFKKQRAKHKSRIEAVWEELSKKHLLFNGKMLNVISVVRNGLHLEVYAHEVSYKDFIAQRHDPSVNLKIRTIGVSGIVIVRDRHDAAYVVFARRKPGVTQWPGAIELVPSGGIDLNFISPSGMVSCEAQILEELAEELHIPPKNVAKVSTFALVYDFAERVYDICCRLEFYVRKEEIGKMFVGSAEYEPPIYVPYRDVRTFVSAHRKHIVPTSLALLSAWQGDLF